MSARRSSLAALAALASIVAAIAPVSRETNIEPQTPNPEPESPRPEPEQPADPATGWGNRAARRRAARLAAKGGR